jgi:L-ascorbate metabolism protein UlaG (beta-lactamase superfamily)
VGDVIGFAVREPDEERTALWVTGDTVLYGELRELAERMSVDVAVVHLGGVRFPITGPLRYTLTAREAAELCELLEPRVAIPIHYEGWSHFRQGREAAEREFAGAPARVRNAIRWLEPGEPVDVA